MTVEIRDPDEIQAAADAMNGLGVGVADPDAPCPLSPQELTDKCEALEATVAELQEALDMLPPIPTMITVDEDGNFIATFDDGSTGPYGGTVPTTDEDTFLQPGDYPADANGDVSIPLINAGGTPCLDAAGQPKTVDFNVTSPAGTIVTLAGSYSDEASAQAAADAAIADGVAYIKTADGCWAWSNENGVACLTLRPPHHTYAEAAGDDNFLVWNEPDWPGNMDGLLPQSAFVRNIHPCLDAHGIIDFSGSPVWTRIGQGVFATLPNMYVNGALVATPAANNSGIGINPDTGIDIGVQSSSQGDKDRYTTTPGSIITADYDTDVRVEVSGFGVFSHTHPNNGGMVVEPKYISINFSTSEV